MPRFRINPSREIGALLFSSSVPKRFRYLEFLLLMSSYSNVIAVLDVSVQVVEGIVSTLNFINLEVVYSQVDPHRDPNESSSHDSGHTSPGLSPVLFPFFSHVHTGAYSPVSTKEIEAPGLPVEVRVEAHYAVMKKSRVEITKCEKNFGTHNISFTTVTRDRFPSC